jgi:hypothetical protein
MVTLPLRYPRLHGNINISPSMAHANCLYNPLNDTVTRLAAVSAVIVIEIGRQCSKAYDLMSAQHIGHAPE